MNIPGGFFLTAALGLSLAGFAEAALVVEPNRLGNVFLTSEPVEIPVRGTGEEIVWTVKNFFGDTVATGTERFLAGRVTLRPKPPEIGYFDLHLVEKTSGAVISQLATAFATVPPVDVSRMGDSPFGVQTHFAQYNAPPVMELIARAGITHFRDEHYWDSLEVQKGVFAFPTPFTNFMAAAQSRGLRPLLTLNWANRHYDFEAGTYTAPHTEGGRQGFATYAQQLVSRYGTQLQQVEVWNEFNGDTFVKGPAAAQKPLNYVALLKAVSERVRATNSNVKVVAGAAVPVPHGFLRDIFAQGAMSYLDVVSVHPYRSVPEGVDLDIAELRRLIREHNGGAEKPVWATEFSADVPSEAASYDAASYLVRIITQMLGAGVERMYYYHLQDDTYFPHRGLIRKTDAARGNYLPRPTYVAYATAIRQLYGWAFQTRVTELAPTTFAYRFGQNGRSKYVCWGATPTTLRITTSAPVTLTDVMGNRRVINPTAGEVLLANVGPDPIYLEGELASFAELPNPVLADSLTGYSKVQGQNGWSYGYANLGSADAYRPEDFRPMEWGIWGAYNFRWLGTSGYHFQAQSEVHPGGAWSIRRWKSHVSGVVKITGDLARGAGGDGVGIRIFQNGAEKLNLTVSPGQKRSYEIANLTVVPGSFIDFATTQLGNNNYDATQFSARVTLISSPPAPAATPAPIATPVATPTPASSLAAPTGLTARGVADNRIQLNWSDNAAGEQGYVIEWKWGSQPYAVAATVGPDTKSYLHGYSMAGGRLYSYRVRAFSGSQSSGYSNVASSTDTP
ncbi:MAG TPA: hypothetical protein VF593_00330 [Chthoniobacteraceae bacterium]|jgi:hypothetical protein